MRILLLSIFLAFPAWLTAQELNCRVKVQAPQVQGTQYKQIFQSMQQDIRDFMNDRKWTDLQYEVEERIDCNLLITIRNAVSQTRFEGTIQVQSSRPVFNSNYNTTVLNYNDKNFTVDYLENATLRFTPEQFQSNLTSILAFYAYLIIGMDHDTFAPDGGDPFFQKAKNIVSNAQNAKEKGWQAQQSNTNRYWLIENALHEVFSPLRTCMYEYHRKGLDQMYEDQKKGRKNITEALEKLEGVYNKRPGSFNLQLFFTAKSDEIVKIYSEATPPEKSKIFNLLRRIDPSNISKYRQIVQNG